MRRFAALLLFLPGCSLLFPIDENAYEGRPDASEPLPDANQPFCDGVDAEFCADFDEGTVDAGWSSAELDPGSTFDLDPLVAKSGASAHAVLPTTGKYAIVLKSIDSGYRLVSLEFDFKLEPLAWGDAAGNASIVDLDWFAPDGSGIGHGLDVGPAYFEISTARPNLTYSFPDAGARPIPTGEWKHLRIDAEPKTSGGTLKVWLDGTLVIENDALDFANIGANRIIFRIGPVRVTQPTPEFDVHYDNVVFRFL